MRVTKNGDRMERYIRNPEFYGSNLINYEDAIVTERVGIAKLKTPIFVGGTALDNRKHLMYDFRYMQACNIFGSDMRVANVDTDSLIIKYNLAKEEVEKKMKEHQDLFDYSN